MIDWASHKASREAVAAEEEMWVGLADEHGVPFDLVFPPLLSMVAPETRNSPVSLRVTAVVKSPSGEVHPLVDELFAEGFSAVGVDREGRLNVVLDSTRYVYVLRDRLRAYRVTHCVLSGGFDAPEQIEIHGADMLSELNRHVAWTAPARELGRFTTFTRDWAGPENVGVQFKEPRDLQDIKLVTVADGVTLSGPAESTLREMIKVSLETGWARTGVRSVVDDPPIVVAPGGSGLESSEILIRATDDKLLDTVAPVAAAAGVRISAVMWLPGDDPVEGLVLGESPKIVVRVEQTVEVS